MGHKSGNKLKQSDLISCLRLSAMVVFLLDSAWDVVAIVHLVGPAAIVLEVDPAVQGKVAPICATQELMRCPVREWDTRSGGRR